MSRHLNEKEHNARLELYKQGLSDSEIGEKLFLNRTTVQQWRKANSLKANYKVGFEKVNKFQLNRISKEDYEKRMELYEAGLVDSEIAKRVCVGKQAIFAWRKKNGLKPNVKKNKSEEAKKAKEEYGK